MESMRWEERLDAIIYRNLTASILSMAVLFLSVALQRALRPSGNAAPLERSLLAADCRCHTTRGILPIPPTSNGVQMCIKMQCASESLTLPALVYRLSIQFEIALSKSISKNVLPVRRTTPIGFSHKFTFIVKLEKANCFYFF